MDKFNKETRSKIMKAVKSKGNLTTEIAFKKILQKMKIGDWELHPKLKGKPDFYFRKSNTVICPSNRIAAPETNGFLSCKQTRFSA